MAAAAMVAQLAAYAVAATAYLQPWLARRSAQKSGVRNACGGRRRLWRRHQMRTVGWLQYACGVAG